jgi:tetratricopeptide (TPR) repeat protein
MSRALSPLAPPAVSASVPSVDRVRDLYDRGLYVQAHRQAALLGPPETWDGTGARILGARLLMQVGAGRRGRLLLLRAWRRDRRHLEACQYLAYDLLRHRGPLACWQFARRVGEGDGAPPVDQAHWCLVRAEALALMREFSGVEALLARARALAPDDPWADVVEAGCLQEQDRRAEALLVARRALERRARYRPALQVTAQILAELGREDEALATLVDGDTHLEAAQLAMQRAALELELGRHAEARASLARVVELSPEMDIVLAMAIAFQMGEAAYLMGDVDEALRHLTGLGPHAPEGLRERLAAARRCGRVQLPVRFVRQHHMTCAPATLAALASYWRRPAEHLEIAEEICYDGTPAHSERRWAERSGFVARQFRVDWDAARALVDRGVPFTMALVQPGMAHLVAVVGYDDVRRSLLVRDPSVHWVREARVDELLATQVATGPRGMTLAPAAEAERLDGVTLPDAALYDDLHALELALDQHDRDAAARRAAALEQAAPGHRITVLARRALAAYDADAPALHEATVAALALDPADVNLQLADLDGLERLGRHAEHRARLEALAGAPGAHPLLLLALAANLVGDARERERAEWLIHRAHFGGPADGRGLAVLGELAWCTDRRREAQELVRLACGLRDKDEALAMQLWQMTSPLDGVEAANAWLEARVARLGHRAAGPALSLARALAQLDRRAEAAAVIDRAIALRPDDGELLAEGALAAARTGQKARAQRLLDDAGPRCRPALWLRVAAQVARLTGDADGAEKRWRELLEREPLALDAHEALVALLTATSGPVAAAEHVRAVTARFPHHRGIARLLAVTLREVDAGEAERRLRAHLELHRDDAWAKRELALRLADLGRHDEARVLAREAGAIEPGATGWNTLAAVEIAAGRRVEASAAYREALRADPHDTAALAALASLAGTPGERWGVLDEARRAFGPAPAPGQALALAQNPLASAYPQEVLELVRGTMRAWPGDLRAWAALIAQCRAAGRHDEAHALATEASERFPMQAGAWIELARSAERAGDAAATRAALERALAVDAGATPASLALARRLIKDGAHDEALRVLAAAAAYAPDDEELPVLVAQARWMKGARAEAWRGLVDRLSKHPRDGAAWEALVGIAADADRRVETLRFARGLVAQARPAPEACVALASLLAGDPGACAERVAACDRAIAAAPLWIGGHDEKAVALAEAERWDEALAACRPAGWGEHVPEALRGRAAWIRARRGDRAGAKDEVEQLLAQRPTYDWGLRQLVDWCRESGDWRPLLRLARPLAEGRPADADVRVLIAVAHLETRAREEARAWLRKALEIQPRHAEAAQRLFDVCFELRDFEGARASLRHCDEHDPFAAARATRLAALELDREAALAGLARVCQHTGDEAWPIAHAMQALGDLGVERRANAILEAQLVAERWSGPVVGAWLESMVARARVWPLIWSRLRGLRRRSSAGMEATALYLEQARLGRALVLLFLALHGAVLRVASRTWSAMGRALLGVRLDRIAAAWLGDWRRRKDLAPYMLVNVAVAMRGRGRDDEARAAHALALTLPPDHSTDGHLALRALDAALAGDTSGARDFLARMQGGDDSRLTFLAKGLVEALLRRWDGSQYEGDDPVRGARAIFDAALEGQTGLGAALRRLRRQVAAVLRDARPGVMSWLWWLSSRGW